MATVTANSYSAGNNEGLILSPTSILLKKYNFTINPTPSDATVTFNTAPGTVSGNSLLNVLPGKSIGYTVTKPRYSTVTDTYTMGNNNYTQNVTVTDIMITLTVVPTPSDATVTLSAPGYTTVTGVGEQSIEVVDHTYVTVNIAKTDWNTYNETVEVVIDESTYGHHMWGYVSLYKELRLVASFTAGTEDVITYALDGTRFNYVRVIMGGAAGQSTAGSGSSDTSWQGTVGRGAVLNISSYFSGSPQIQCVLGKQPVKEVGESYKGGWGYNYGGNGGYIINPQGFTGYIYAGGGGGSSAIVFDRIYEADGGGGAGCYEANFAIVQGANGGGTYGGLPTPVDGSVTGVINGNDATNPDSYALNDGPGFINIYAAYYPES